MKKVVTVIVLLCFIFINAGFIEADTTPYCGFPVGELAWGDGCRNVWGFPGWQYDTAIDDSQSINSNFEYGEVASPRLGYLNDGQYGCNDIFNPTSTYGFDYRCVKCDDGYVLNASGDCISAPPGTSCESLGGVCSETPVESEEFIYSLKLDCPESRSCFCKLGSLPNVQGDACTGLGECGVADENKFDNFSSDDWRLCEFGLVQNFQTITSEGWTWTCYGTDSQESCSAEKEVGAGEPGTRVPLNGGCDVGKTKCPDGTCSDDCSVSVCGDGYCTNQETYATCPSDCTIPSCGDGTCQAGNGETCSTCQVDCNAQCPPLGGNDNGICEPDEGCTASDCPEQQDSCATGLLCSSSAPYVCTPGGGGGGGGNPICNSIFSCANYNQEQCGQDSTLCNVAGISKFTFLEETASKGKAGECYQEKDYSCAWNEGKCKTIWTPKTIDAGCPSVLAGGDGYPDSIGTCVYEDKTQDTCVGDGLMQLEWEADWTWASGNEESQIDPANERLKCTSSSKVVPCPNQVALKFITARTIILLVLAIVVIYIVISLKKKKKRSVSVNRSRTKRATRKRVGRKKRY